MKQLYSYASLIRSLAATPPGGIRYRLPVLLAVGRKCAPGAWLSLLLLVLALLPSQSYADSGLYKDAVLLQVSPAASPAYYYTIPASASNKYQNASLGSFARGTGARLVLAGGEANTYQHDGVTVQAAQLRYRLYLTGTPPGLFSSLDLPYLAAGRDGDAGNRAWAQTAAGVDLLAIAAQPGSYVLEVYFQAQGKDNGQSISNFDNRSGANYQATFTVTAPLPPNNPSDNQERNWTMERSFDGNGQEVAASKQFTDGLGRATQAQARNAATKQVFAAQTVYSTGGQPVLQTMAAPINNQGFSYKENFITAGGQPYGPDNFENGLASNPSPVDTTRGTVGYYYSQLNKAEPLTPITSYPYSLTEPYDGPMGGTRRAAGPGDELRMGKGREAKGRDFPLRKEFDGYLALRSRFVPGSSASSLEYQGIKSVSINADGRESIVVANKDGQAIISCLSGPQYPALPVEGYVSAEGPTNPYDPNAPAYQDIHLPAAGPQDVRFTMDPAYTNGGRVLLVNLLTNDTTSYAVKPATTGAAPEQHLTLNPGFYRVVSVTGTQRLFYEAHYGDFSYTYYDDAGRVVATVAPLGVPGATNYVRNGNLELGNADTGMWQSPANSGGGYLEASTPAHPAHSGNYYWAHYYPSGPWQAYTTQLVTGLPDGRYTLRAWVQSLGNVQATMRAVSNSVTYEASFSDMTAGMPWRQVVLADVDVRNGQCEIGFHSSANQSSGIRFDDVELVRQNDNAVRNSGMEQPGSTVWLSRSSVGDGDSFREEATSRPAHSGNYYWTQYKNSDDWNAYTYQTVTGLVNGRYTLRAWVQSSGGQQQAWMQAISGGVTQEVSFTDVTAGMPWRQVVLTDILVTNGQCEIGFYSRSLRKTWIAFDDVELLPQDASIVRNSGMEQPGSTVWLNRSSVGDGDSFREEATSRPAHSGNYYWTQYKNSDDWNAYTYQTVTGLVNGRYTLRAWVQSSGGQQQAWMQAISGGVTQEVSFIDVTAGMPWRQIALVDIVVTNNRCEIGFYSRSLRSTWIAFDDVELLPQDASPLPAFTTRNTYDASSRLLATESTDEGRSEYVYAQDGRIRFSQSALQRSAGRFSYSNYDEVGRVVESGEYTPGSLKFENHLTASPATTSVLQPSLLEDRTRGGGLAGASCAQRNQVWYDLPFDGTAGSQGSDSQISGRRQEFVVGAVAKTQNDNVKTWYSYDELGRVTWVVQDVAGVGVKTLDYKYDFSGNVLEVAYQKNQADAFYHYYRYDPAQRLTAVYTSTDGTTQTLQALYSYYLHGPLKRVQLAGNLQGIDYTYTLQGALKAINHVNQTLEPGHDAPAANGVYKDLFALTLDYFSGDYRSRAIDTPLPIAGGAAVPTRYDGTIQGAAWRTGASAGIHRVAYTYDEKSQLQNSQYGKWDWQKNSSNYLLNPASANALQEGNLRYDANGNLQSLRRTDQAGNVADDFSYGYKPNTNQLKEVHTGSAAGPTVLDYDYDELGQLVRQRDEKGQSYLSYDVTGKTTGFYADAARTQPLVTFAYDDRGFRVSKTTYADGVARQITTYVRDVAGNILTVYDQFLADDLPTSGAVQRAEVPLYGASRLGSLTHLNDGTAAGLDDYRYELNDHLGDARVVFHRPTTTVDVETMELSGVPGRAAFLNDDRYRVAVSGAPSGDYVARLTDSQPAGQELKRVLSVSKGDTITFSALAQWKQNAAAGGNSITPFILAGAAAGLAPLSQRGPEGQTAYQTNSPNWLSLLAAGLGFTLGGGNQSASLGSTSLTGWIKYRVLDANGNEQASGRDYLLGTGQWEYLQTGVRITQAGTIEVMAGTSGSGEAVYFDNLRVEQTGGLIVQEQHQYAFGAPLPGLSYVVGSKRYRYGYQGQYAERDSVTGFESFELRLYNSRVGRWISYDPEGQFNSPYVGMGNNPVSNIDPDGGRVPLPKFRPSGSGAVSGLSSLAKWGMRTGSSILRTASSYLEKGDAWVHSDTGENVGRRVAEFNPAVTAANLISSATTGSNAFGEKTDKGDIAWNVVELVPEEKFIALGGKLLLASAKPMLAMAKFGIRIERLVKVSSIVRKDAKLFKYAEETFAGNKLLSQEANDLVHRFMGGNMNPGIGNNVIDSAKGIFELRSRGGARVYMRKVKDAYEILAYSNKGNQSQVIGRLLSIY